MFSRNGSSDFIVGLNSKSAPAVVGVHRNFLGLLSLHPMMPFGVYTYPSRTGAFFIVCATAVSGENIESSTGRAIVAPTPRRNVRRGSVLLVMIMTPKPSSSGTVCSSRWK